MRRLLGILPLLAYLGLAFIFTAAPSGGGGGGGVSAATPTPNDVTFRTTINAGACAASGTASATCSNAATGDLLLIIGADCSGTSTQTCPAGTTTVKSDGAGGTTVTVCSRTATAGDSTTAYKITSTAHNITTGCIDMFSPSSQTVAVAAVTAAACTLPIASWFVGPLVTATAPPYIELGIIGAQTAVPFPLGFILTPGASTALTAQWEPAAMTQAPSLLWNSASASSSECLALLISG